MHEPVIEPRLFVVVNRHLEANRSAYVAVHDLESEIDLVEHRRAVISRVALRYTLPSPSSAIRKYMSARSLIEVELFP